MKFKTNLIIKSNLLEIKDTIETLLQRMKSFLNKEDLLFEMKLILNELIINSAMHGNNMDESKSIKLDLEIDNSTIKLEVIDEGQGFIYDKDAYNPLELTSNGRGLVIVDGLSDEFLVQNNRVSIVKYITQ